MNQNNSLESLLQQGHLLLERGQYEVSLKIFQQADNLFPDRPPVKYGLGLTCFRLERFQDSVEYLTLGWELGSPLAHLSEEETVKAPLLRGLGDRLLALARRGKEEEGNIEEVGNRPMLLALVRRGMAYKALQQTELANADLKAVLQLEAITHEDWRARGIAFDELKRSEEALECYERALEIEPNNHQTWQNKGLTLQDLQRFEEALECFDRTLAILPDKLFAWRSRGFVLMILKLYQDAVASFDRALELKSDDYGSLSQKGLSLASLGQFQEAIASYDRALQIKPDDFVTWWFRGDALSSLKQYEEALSCYDKALEINPDFQPVKEKWADIQHNLGLVYSDRLEGNRRENLELAIAAYTSTLRVYTESDFPTQWAMTQNNLGSAYRNRIAGGRQENIESAIACYTDVLRVYTEQTSPRNWAIVQYNLGVVYMERIKGDRAENLEIAIAYLQTALRVRTKEAFSQDWADTQISLGVVYNERIKGDRVENLEIAIAHFQAASQVLTEQNFPHDWGILQNNLGNAYSNRVKGNKVENLNLAIASFKNALKIFNQETSPLEWGNAVRNLGIAYANYVRIEGIEKGNDNNNLENAISYLESAFQVFTKQNFLLEWAKTHFNIGSCYAENIERLSGDRRKDSEKGISHCQSALQVYTRVASPQDWAMIQNNMAICYGSAKKIKSAFACYKKALTIITPQNDPISCLQATRNFGNLAFTEGNWQLAIDVYSTAIEAVEQSREWATDDQRKQAIISDAIEVYQNIVQACINLGQIDKAIEYVERGKARNLVDLLATRDLYPKGDIPEEIVTRLDSLRQQAIAEERRLRQQGNLGGGFDSSSGGDNRSLVANSSNNNAALDRTRLNNLRQELENLVKEEIQEKDPSFQLTQRVEPINFKKIKQTLPTNQTALIEWYVGNEALSAFIVTTQGKQPVHLPFNSEQFQALINSVDQYLYTYLQRDKQWQIELDNLLTQLAQNLQLETIIEQIKQLIPDCDQIILVPHRFLHLFPIHALPLADGKFLLDLFPQGVSYAPSVQLLKLTQRQSKPRLNNLFAVQNPTQDLNFTNIEVQVIRSQFQPNDDVLKHQQATKLALTKERLGQANLIHFSCHGYFNFENPELSALLLAESKVETGDREDKGNKIRFFPSRDGGNIDLEKCLTLGEIFALDLRNCRLVTLSACETGLTDFKSLSDEYIGLPSGFLFAGSPSVVSSLWAVNDLSTSFLMIKFYQNLQEIDSVPIALNQAQLWLRSVTKEELEEWSGQLPIPLNQRPYIDAALMDATPNSRPFASPYYWAAFCAVGS